MRERFLASLAEAAKPIRGASVLLWGFSGRGFPAGSGAIEAAQYLPEVGVDAVYSHRLDPAAPDALSRRYDFVIVSNTRVGDIIKHDARVWDVAKSRIYWFWDLRPGKTGAPLRGKPTHVFLSYNGEWTSPEGELYRPEQWRSALDVPVGYCPQASPLRGAVIGAPEQQRMLFIGDLNNKTYHRGRREMCRRLGATVMNQRKRDGRLEIEARMPSLYARARYCLSMSPMAPGYTSVRTYSILACSGLLLLHRFPGADEIFTDGEDAVLFNDADHAIERMRELDDNPAERQRIAENGRLLQATRHTVAHRVVQMCRQVTEC